MTKLLVKGIFCSNPHLGNLFLWNPSIRKIVKLPPSLTPVTSNVPKLPSIVVTAVGFGFDQRSNDYKVVKIGYLVDYKSGLDVSWMVEIYFLRASASALKLIVHWIAFVSGLWSFIVLAFDMGGEVFTEMALPNHLVKLRDSTTMHVMTFHMWIMEEYGVKESWTRRSTIIQLGEFWSVVGLQKNGDVLMVAEEEKLVWNDPQSQQIKKHLGINGSYHSFYVVTYMESLVALDAPNGVGKDNPNSLDAVVNKEASRRKRKKQRKRKRAMAESGDQLQERRSIKLEG
ncbi:unnamed protein product [Camellia sinensis]